MSEDLSPLIQQLNKVLNGLQQTTRQVFTRIEDSLALEQLPQLNKDVYLPWTRSAMCPSSLQLVLNEILIHQRKLIVECGSGVSTIYINKILEHHDAKFVSIDNDLQWQEIVKQQAKTLDVDISKTTFIHAPLKFCPLSPKKLEWYDLDILGASIPNEEIDLLLVDAPLASRQGLEESRFPALPYFAEKLANNFAVFLDDCNRPGEQNIAKAWAEKYDLDAIFLPEKGNICMFFPKNVKRFNVI